MPDVNVYVESAGQVPSTSLEKVGAIIGTADGTITQVGTVPGGTATGAMSGTYAADITLPVRQRFGEPSVLLSGGAIPAGRVCTVSGTLNSDGTRNCTVVDTLDVVAADNGAVKWTYSDMENDAVREYYGDGTLTDAIEDTLLKGGREISVWGWKTSTTGVSTGVSATIDALLADVNVLDLLPTKILIADPVSGATYATLSSKQTSLGIGQINVEISASCAPPSSPTAMAAYITSLKSGYPLTSAQAVGVSAGYSVFTDNRGVRSGRPAMNVGIFAAKLRNDSQEAVSFRGNPLNVVAEVADIPNISDTVKTFSDSQAKTLDEAQFVVLRKQVGAAGYIAEHDWTKSSNSVFARASWTRIAYKLARAIRQARQATVQAVYVRENGTISPEDKVAYDAVAVGILENAKNKREISGMATDPVTRKTLQYYTSTVDAAGNVAGRMQYEVLGLFENITESVVMTFSV